MLRVDREHGPESRAKRRHRGFKRAFNVFRIKVGASDDQEILLPTRDKELALPKEAQITRPQKLILLVSGEMSTERCGTFIATVPVAPPNALAADPDLTNRPSGALPPRR